MVELLQAGFHPEGLEYLRGKIRYIVQQTITTTVEKYQIPLPLSTKAFIVPGMWFFRAVVNVTTICTVLQTLSVFSRKARSSTNPRKKSLIRKRKHCSMLSGVMYWYVVNVMSRLLLLI